MKAKKIYTIAAVIIVLALLAFLIYLLLQKKKADDQINALNDYLKTNADAAKAADEKAISAIPEAAKKTKTADELGLPTDIFPLSLGSGMNGDTSSQPYVKQVQKQINTQINAGIKTDGQWGKNTQDAALELYRLAPYHFDWNTFDVDNKHYEFISISRDLYAALYAE